MVNAQINQQRPRPTNVMLNQLTQNITRENIQQRFQTAFRNELQRPNGYLGFCEGLTYADLTDICSEDMNICQPIISQVMSGFIQITDDEDSTDGELNYIVGEWLFEIIGDDFNNPLYHICDNIIDDTIKPFIQTTHSVILNRPIPYNHTHKTTILIDYVGCIIYWYATPWIREWAREELRLRLDETPQNRCRRHCGNTCQQRCIHDNPPINIDAYDEDDADIENTDE